MWRIATNKNDTSDELRVKLLPLLASRGLELDGSRRGARLGGAPAHQGMDGDPPCASWWAQTRSCARRTPPARSCSPPSTPIPPRSARTAWPTPWRRGRCTGSPWIVVDFGTATNIEVVDARRALPRRRYRAGRGDFGLRAVLARHRSCRPSSWRPACGHRAQHGGGHPGGHRVRRGRPRGRLVRRIFDQLGYETPVVATGGLASRVARSRVPSPT